MRKLKQNGVSSPKREDKEKKRPQLPGREVLRQQWIPIRKGRRMKTTMTMINREREWRQ